MLYKDFNGKKLSALGFGTMRLPVIDGDEARIDVPAATQMVTAAMENGINYYDTAWCYHNGNAETVIGELLHAYPREKWYLADKFPGYDLANMDKVEEIFEAQLKKCGVEYFDFYLFHNVCELNIEQYLDEKRYGIFSYLKKQRDAGRIRHLGFSTHGTPETMQRFLDAYGTDMEFCQIQLNWLDWSFQDAKRKVELLEEHDIPVWVMEPLRGGRLAKLQPSDEETLKKLRPEEPIAAWSFRFLQSLPDVKVILSGMSDLSQLEANLATFSNAQPLGDDEKKQLLRIGAEMTKQKTVPCTGCHYCVPHCLQELDIPALLKLYNEHNFSDGGFIAPMALDALPADKQPDACLGCRSCESVCPQGIRVSEIMKDFSAKLKR